MRDIIVVDENAANAIKIALVKKDMSQTDLAEAVGRTRQSIQQTLNRPSKGLRAQTMREFANAIGYDLVLMEK